MVSTGVGGIIVRRLHGNGVVGAGRAAHACCRCAVGCRQARHGHGHGVTHQGTQWQEGDHEDEQQSAHGAE